MSNVALETAQAPLVLALDIGSSSVRALLFDANGHQVEGSESQHPYTAHLTADGGVEIDPVALFDLSLACIDETLASSSERASEIKGVGCSTFWHAMMGLDEAFSPTTPILMWSDKRSGPDAVELRKELNPTEIHDQTGCRLHSSYWPAKLRWLKRTQPEVFARTQYWVSFVDFLAYRITGQLQTSISMASGTGLLDTKSLQWHEGLLNTLGIKGGQLPPLIDRDEPLGSVEDTYRERWPALAEIPWFPALGDGACANVGSGCVGENRIAVTIGTSAALRVILPETIPTDHLSDRIWCYRLDRDHKVVGGALSNGGNITGWLAKLVADGDFSDLSTQAESMTPDSHGLTFLPFLAGERSPSWNDEASGTIHGLRLSTTSADLYRAALEAAGYRLDTIYEAVKGFTSSNREIHVNGAAALASPLWLQILADVLDHQVDAVDADAEASARGAALCTLNAVGAIGDLESLSNPITRSFVPESDAHEVYRLARKRQEELEHRIYPSLKDANEEL